MLLKPVCTIISGKKTNRPATPHTGAKQTGQKMEIDMETRCQTNANNVSNRGRKAHSCNDIQTDTLMVR